MNVFLNATKDALMPFSPSLSSGAEATAAYLAARQYNAAVKYAASKSLIYPMRSSTVRSMLRTANTTAASGALISFDLALAQGLAVEVYALSNGGCR